MSEATKATNVASPGPVATWLAVDVYVGLVLVGAELEGTVELPNANTMGVVAVSKRVALAMSEVCTTPSREAYVKSSRARAKNEIAARCPCTS